MAEKKCSCCDGDAKECKQMTLADLPVGVTATIVEVKSDMPGRKKFADVGLVEGTELLMEAHAPFGGLIRVKVMETSMALHRDSAEGIILGEKE